MRKQKKQTFMAIVLTLVMVISLLPAMTLTVSAESETVKMIHLEHGETISDYGTIQAAVDESVDGDTITIDAGTIREQVIIDKSITIQGAGIDQTIIESPNGEDLEISGGDWKTLKNTDVFAIIGIKTTSDGAVTIKDLTVDGRDEGYLPDTSYPNKMDYAFQGIGAYNSNLIVDTVKVTRVREVGNDYGDPLPDGYPEDQPSGMNHNENIFAESADGAGTHTLTVTNSIITKYQKTGILAWGPTLMVDINNNTIQAEKTISNTGNGIQVASSDYSSSGGGNRAGTSGSITDNTLTGIGLVIPEPGEEGSYLNMGQLGPTAIMLWEAADDFEISGNTVTGQGVPSWHYHNASYDGDGYGNEGIGVWFSNNSVIEDNIVSGFDTGIIEYGTSTSAKVLGNVFNENTIDIWATTADDQIELSDGGEVLAYMETDNGVDTITGFGDGDKITVIATVDGAVNGMIGTVPIYMTDTEGHNVINGYADATPVVTFNGGTVTEGDGTSVAAQSMQLSVSGSTTTLYIDTDAVEDAAELTINLTGVYDVKNFKLNGAYIEYQGIDYTINTTDKHCWTDNSSIMLANDGDSLELLSTASPLSGVRIHVTAPDGSTVTIKGSGTDYSNIRVEIDNDVTLNIENLSITSYENYPALQFNKADTDPEGVTLQVSGTCNLTGSGWASGIISDTDQSLTIKGSGVLNTTGSSSDSAGHGIHMKGNAAADPMGTGAKLLIDGGVTVNATGANAGDYSGGCGISLSWGNLEIVNSTVTATGGSSSSMTGGNGIYADNSIAITDSNVTATGGNGHANGGHAVYSNKGTITVETGANLSAVGGNGTTQGGGVGLRAAGYDGTTFFGNTVTIAKSAGDVYIRGGQGAMVQRASIMGKDVYIATGNIGTVLMETAAVTRSIKNSAGGDDVYLVNASTNPVAAVTIQSSVSGTLGGSYTYRAVAKSDGTACLWLPSGSQTLSATGYQSKNLSVAADDTQANAIELTTTQPHTGGSKSTPPDASVIVNGESKSAGMSSTTTGKDGKTTTTVTVDTSKLKDILESEGSGATVIIPVTSGSDVAAGVLSGEMIKSMEKREANLVIQTGSTTYTLPVSEIDIDAVSTQLGTDVSLSDIEVTVEIAEPSSHTVTVVENAAQDGGFSIVVPAVDFTINCTYNRQKVNVSSFNNYVERMIAIPHGVDPTKITTGVVVKPDKTTYHVPTQIVEIDGKYYAKINSLTNSTYTVVWHPVEFADVASHWAKDSINNMGSRMVVNGDQKGNYNPNKNITRAEFAAIVVRALGLAPGAGENNFGDVASSAWYCGYVETATSYGIIKGYDNGNFGPSNTITREQAMAMLARAMKITGIDVNLTDSDVSTLLGAYTDGASVSAYAKDSIARCLKTGITSGTSKTTISSKAYITRAQVSVMVERLLQKSDLI